MVKTRALRSISKSCCLSVKVSNHQQSYLSTAFTQPSTSQNIQKPWKLPITDIIMKFTTVSALAAAFVGFAAASPIEERQTYSACSGLYGSPLCCATDVLGVADLDCGEREFPNILQYAVSNKESSHRGLHKRPRVLGRLLGYRTACSLLRAAYPRARSSLQHPHRC